MAARIIKLEPIKKVSDGFTIVEIMIATLIFSVILTLATGVILSFTHEYYKAVNSSSTQNTARNVLNQVTQAIAFAGNSPVSSSSAVANGQTINTYCIGPTQFDYISYYPQSSTQYALWQSQDTSASCTTLSTPNSTSVQLLSANMRILNFQICLAQQLAQGMGCTLTGAGQQPTYVVNLSIAYGYGTLLCDTSVSGNQNCPQTDKTTFTDTANVTPGDTFKCIINPGTQYCSVVNLSATMQERG